MEKKELSKLEVVTICIISLSIFIYEICFCNMNDIIVNRTYNFSLYRIVMYSVFIFLYTKFSKKFIEEARKTLESKKKIIYGYIIFAIMYGIYKFVTIKNYYVLSLIVLSEINGLLFILYVTKDYVKNIIISILTFGFIFSISTDVFHIVDDKKHFMSALNLATGNFNVKEGYTNDEFNNIPFDYPTVNFAMEYFSKKSSFDMHKIPEDESIFSTQTDYCPLLYLPYAVGIDCARFLGGSIADCYFAGRIFNVIAYGALLICIFKILPFKKNVFYVSYSMPITLALAGSYSIDGITIGLVGLFIAYVFKIYKESKDDGSVINLKKFLILLVLFMLVLLCKNGAYLGVGLLVCILPIFKIIKENKSIRNILIILVILAIFIGIMQGLRLKNSEQGDIRVDNTSPSKQIEFLLSDPTNIVKVYVRYIKNTLLSLSWYNNFNLKVFFGNYTYAVSYMLFLLILYTALTDDSYVFDKKENIVTTFTFFGVYFITTFILYLTYTKVGSFTINGYQARYLICVIPLLLSNINGKKVTIMHKENTYNEFAMFMGIITVLDLVSAITI